MKNFPLVLLLVLCTGFIISLNVAYLQKIVVHFDLRAPDVHDQPSPKTIKVSTTFAKKPAIQDTPTKTTGAVRGEPLQLEPKSKTTTALPNNDDDVHRVAGLNCDKYGGPSEDIAAEMVYWQDIPRDAKYESPYANYGKSPKYLTFEPDEGGWNNIRMSMETATVLAQAMGRILVLPPEQEIYLLGNDKKNHKNNRFTFKDFFHFDSIAVEHDAVEVISMEEFMKREALSGSLINKFSGEVEFPPDNATIWNGHGRKGRKYWLWLRNVTAAPIWSFDKCVVGFPAEAGPEGVKSMETIRATIPEGGKNFMSEYDGNPTKVDAPPEARLREMLGTRRGMCIYDDEFQNEKVIHFMGDNASGARLLVHFYAYLFFENFHHDLWAKRFVRDHLRYIDEIQCASARIVHAVRQKAIEHGDPTGNFDSFHIRRGDFQYKETRITAQEIYEYTKDVLVPNSTIFIATDERDASFFDPMREHYNLLFLNDFKHLIEGLNTNFMGMLDQRIASRGRTFIGAYFSTFTGTYWRGTFFALICNCASSSSSLALVS